MTDKVDVDARGMLCPWPALRLARAMRVQTTVTIVADDPVAPQEITALAKQQDWALEAVETALGEGFLVSRRP